MPLDGESWNTFSVRAVHAIDSFAARHRGRRPAVVTHSGVIRAYVDHVLDITREAFARYHLANGSISLLTSMETDCAEARWQTAMLNMTGHLSGTAVHGVLAP